MLDGSPDLMVMGRDSRSEGRGFQSQCRILDEHFVKDMNMEYKVLIIRLA